MPSYLSNIRARIAAGLPELVMDRSDPRFSRISVSDDRILHAIHELANELEANPKARVSIEQKAKKYHVPLAALREMFKNYKAEDRILTSGQELLLCQRLDRLTRYGGNAQASEEPIEVKKLIEKYAIGVLRLLEHNDFDVAYSLQPHWVPDFLSRHARYAVLTDGGPASPGSTHPQTSSDDPWYLPHQKTALYNILEKYYPLRSNKGLEEYWKTVRRMAKQQIGYCSFDLSAQNEMFQRECQPHPPTGLHITALGKRKRGSSELERTVGWRVWDTACNDFVSVKMGVGRKLDTPRCSPPPDLEVLVEEDQPQHATTIDRPTSADTVNLANSTWHSTVQTVQNSDSQYFTLEDPYRAEMASSRAAYDVEDADIRLANALGSLARAKQSNAAKTSRLYNLPERLVRESWAGRRTRPQVAAEKLLKDQERRLHSRLQNLVPFGGNVMPVEASISEYSAATVVQAYADGILAEDDQLVECNMVVHANWAVDFLKFNHRYAASTTRRV